MRLLETHVISDLLRNSQGGAASRLAAVGEAAVMMRVIVAGERRDDRLGRSSDRPIERVEAALREIVVIAVGPYAAADGAVRARLDAAGKPFAGKTSGSQPSRRPSARRSSPKTSAHLGRGRPLRRELARALIAPPRRPRLGGLPAAPFHRSRRNSSADDFRPTRARRRSSSERLIAA